MSCLWPKLTHCLWPKIDTLQFFLCKTWGYSHQSWIFSSFHCSWPLLPKEHQACTFVSRPVEVDQLEFLAPMFLAPILPMTAVPIGALFRLGGTVFCLSLAISSSVWHTSSGNRPEEFKWLLSKAHHMFSQHSAKVDPIKRLLNKVMLPICTKRVSITCCIAVPMQKVTFWLKAG